MIFSLLFIVIIIAITSRPPHKNTHLSVTEDQGAEDYLFDFYATLTHKTHDNVRHSNQ